MKKNINIITTLALAGILTATCACTSTTVANNNTTENNSTSAVHETESASDIEPTSVSSTKPSAAAKAIAEEEMKLTIEAKSQCLTSTYVYMDMDNDGLEEMVNLVAADSNKSKSAAFEIWYCDSLGENPYKVSEITYNYEQCEIEKIPLSNGETLIAVNAFNSLGNATAFSLLELRDGTISTIIDSHIGLIEPTGVENEAIITIEDYDGYYDPSIKTTIMHTWKPCYVYYDRASRTLKDYEAKKISEEDFMKYSNAKDIISVIKANTIIMSNSNLKMEYYVRTNGLLQIAIEEIDDKDGIYYYYYTYRINESTLVGDVSDNQSDKVSGKLLLSID